jgi:hypothetical protein
VKTSLTWIVAALLAALPAAAADVAGHATVTIAPPGLVLVRDSSLSFGTIASSANPGSVTIAPDASMSSTGGVAVVTNGFPAQFTASSTAKANQFFWIEVPDDTTIALTRPGFPAPALRVRSFTVSVNVTDPQCVVQSGGAAPPKSAKCPSVKDGVFFTFQVGGTLEVPANPPGGTYSGTFDVTIHRQ